MINKFARAASTYSYYGYLNRYTPEQIRTYQSERMYFLGRRGAFNNLVYKYAADHINYEEDFNMRYKVPTFVTNVTMRLGLFWFISATLIISFGLGDMLRVFRQVEFFYPGRPDSNAETISHYETLYLIDRSVKFWWLIISNMLNQTYNTLSFSNCASHLQ